MRPFDDLRRSAPLRGLLVTVLLLSAWLALGPPPASAEPRITRVDVYSEAMGRWVSNDVISPASGAPAPTFYLLTGIGGGSDGISWFNNTRVRDFFADKHVNVVMPIGGQYSMYTDWAADDPVLGRNKWQTYLTQELPAAIDSRFSTTGSKAIGGVSMAGSGARPGGAGTGVLPCGGLVQRVRTDQWRARAGDGAVDGRTAGRR